MPDLNRITSLVVATLLMVAMAGTATAQSPGTGTDSTGPGTESADQPSSGGGVGSPEFRKLDKNKDGSIDKTEASKDKDLKKQWSSLDLDKDDKIDYGEFARFEAQQGTGDSGKSEESAPPAKQEQPSSPMMLP